MRRPFPGEVLLARQKSMISISVDFPKAFVVSLSPAADERSASTRLTPVVNGRYENPSGWRVQLGSWRGPDNQAVFDLDSADEIKKIRG